MNDLTVNEAAPLLGLKPGSVRTFIDRGMIAAVKRGRDWFITREEVDRYNRERHNPGPRPRVLLMPRDFTNEQLQIIRKEIQEFFNPS